MRRLAALAAALCASAVVSASHEPPPDSGFPLTIDSIMRGPELVGYPPSDLRWSGDSQDLYFEWRRPGDDEAATYVVGRAGGAPRRLSDDERRSAPLANGAWDAAHRRIVGIDRGDIVVIDTVAHTRVDVTRTTATESNPRWTQHDTAVTFLRDNNLYVQDLLDFRITQLTTDGSATLINGTFDWVYEEELGLRNGYRWRPDGQALAYWQLDSAGVKEFHITSSAEGPYTRVVSIRYPKTGERNSAARIGVVSVAGGKTTWLDVPGDPREHYLAKMEWSGAEIALQQFNRLQNVNTVMLADPNTGKVRSILVEKDSAWIDNVNDFRWIDAGRKLVWLSERDGWRHVYLAPRSGDKPAQLTRGAFDVVHIDAIDEKEGVLYFTASPENPTQRYLFRVSLKGGPHERITPRDLPGTHSYSISADARWAVHTHSTFTTPPVTTLIHLPDHKIVKTFADNAALKKKLAALRATPAEFFRVDIGHDTALDGWSIKPASFDPTRKYPVLFHVYGEPAGQTVLDRWDGSRLLWHRMLAQQGYVVLSVDNRGTPAPRGRAWRKCIYRQVGILASADQAAAVRALLKDRPYLDPTRVAVWGWSGGGSMSLNAIFRYPDLYQTAIAIAPVPNQRHYDTIYQERYMGLPADNSDGYRKGSPIHFARQLKGNLLLVHGTGDDNCHYLGLEALIDELIVHNKPFSMLAYPNRSHAINEGKNTRRHLFESITRYLRANTPP